MESWKIYVIINVLFVLLFTFIYFKNKKITKDQIKTNKEEVKVVKAITSIIVLSVIIFSCINSVTRSAKNIV